MNYANKNKPNSNPIFTLPILTTLVRRSLGEGGCAFGAKISPKINLH
jgi:hypothetical protein